MSEDKSLIITRLSICSLVEGTKQFMHSTGLVLTFFWGSSRNLTSLPHILSLAMISIRVFLYKKLVPYVFKWVILIWYV